MALSLKPKGFKCWTMAVPIKKTDNIISSRAAERGQKAFTPAYEKDPQINMNFIMSNEYFRLWFKERESYERDFYFKEQTRREESRIRRRFVQRRVGATHQKKEKQIPIIQIKRFTNLKSKIDSRRNAPKKEDQKNTTVEEEEYEPEF